MVTTGTMTDPPVGEDESFVTARDHDESTKSLDGTLNAIPKPVESMEVETVTDTEKSLDTNMNETGSPKKLQIITDSENDTTMKDNENENDLTKQD